MVAAPYRRRAELTVCVTILKRGPLRDLAGRCILQGD
jgi:hypothetical protein